MAATAALGAGGLLGLASAPAIATVPGFTTQTFTSPGESYFFVPDGVSSVAFTVYGAQGGDNASGVQGGLGAEVSATDVAVTSGQEFDLQVGGQGSVSDQEAGGTDPAGGWPNGGNSGGGGGGGSSAVLDGSNSDAPLIVAGGGGGAGLDGSADVSGVTTTLTGGQGGDSDHAGSTGHDVNASATCDATGGTGGAPGTGSGPGSGGTAGVVVGMVDPSGSNGAPASCPVSIWSDGDWGIGGWSAESGDSEGSGLTTSNVGFGGFGAGGGGGGYHGGGAGGAGYDNGGYGGTPHIIGGAGGGGGGSSYIAPSMTGGSVGDGEEFGAGEIVVSYVVSTGSAPSISGTPPTADEWQPYTFTFTSSGTPAPTFSVTDGILPDGLSLDPTTGTISGTPDQAGSFELTVTASNGVSPDASDSFTLESDGSPTNILCPTSLVAVGSNYDSQSLADGYPYPTLSIASGSLPPGITFDSTNGVYSGTPTQVGTFNFGVNADNGIPPGVTLTCEITVHPALVFHPARGKPGATVTVSGRGFSPDATVTVTWTATTVTKARICRTTVGSDGTFTCTGRIPSAALAGPTGYHQVSAHDPRIWVTRPFLLT